MKRKPRRAQRKHAGYLKNNLKSLTQKAQEPLTLFAVSFATLGLKIYGAGHAGCVRFYAPCVSLNPLGKTLIQRTQESQH